MNHSGRRSETPVFWLEFVCAKPGDDIADSELPDAGWDPPPPKSEVTLRDEAEDREARRRAFRALAAGLAAGAAGFAGGYQAGTTPSPSPAASSCSSDYGCGPGFMCAKRAGLIVGECMRAVSPSGVPTYERNPSGHVGPGENQCAQGCPVGFRCDLGRCIR
jgi:hypothetical protein